MPGVLTLANLQVKLSADLSELSAKFATVGKNFQKLGRQMSSVGASLTRSITMPLMGLIYVMGRGVAGAIQYGNQIDKLSKQTGLAAEEVQKLRYAAMQEHLDFESLTKVFPILSKYMAYAQEGMATYKREFDKMGISVTDSEGRLKSAYDVFLEMSSFMASDGANDTEKLAIAMALLGRRGAEAIPFMKLGRQNLEAMGEEAKKTGAVLSAETIVAMKKFDDKLVQTKERIADVWRGLAADLLPVLNRLVDALVPLIEKLKDSIKWFIELPPWIQKTTFALTALAATSGPVLWYIGSLLTALPKLIGFFKTLSGTTVFLHLAISLKTLQLALIGIAQAAGLTTAAGAAGAFTLLAGAIYLTASKYRELLNLIREEGKAMEAGQKATQKSNDALTDWLLKVRETTPEALRMTDMWQEQYKKATDLLLIYIQTGSEVALRKFEDYMIKLSKMAQKGIKGPEVTAGKAPTAEEAEAFQKQWIQALYGKYAYSIYLLDEEYHKYEEQGIDKVLLEEWYQAEIKKLDEEYLKEKVSREKSAQDEIEKAKRAIYLAGIKDKIEKEKESARLTAQSDIETYTEKINKEIFTDKQKTEYIALYKTARQKQLQMDLSAIDQKGAEDRAKIETEAYVKGITERKDITTQEQIRLLEERRIYLESMGMQETAFYTQLVETINALHSRVPVTMQEKWSEALMIVQQKFRLFGEYVSGLFSDIQSSLATNLAAMMKGTQNAADTLKAIWTSIKDHIIDAIADMIAKWAVFLAMQAATGGGGGFFKWLGFKEGGIIKPVHAQEGLITRGIGVRDVIPAMLRPNEVVMPLDKFPELVGAGAGATNITVNFTMGDVKTDMDYELMKKDLTDTIKNAMRGA